MSNTQWLVEGRVIHYSFEGDGAVEKLQEFNREISTLIEVGTPPIHLILDIEESGKPLLNMGAIAENLAILKHENIQWVITYGKHTNPIFRFLGNVLSSSLGVKSRMFDTKEEAYDFIGHVDFEITKEDLFEGQKNPI